MEQSNSGRALTPMERAEMAAQQDMQERGRRLRLAQRLRGHATELRDGWTGRLIPRDDTDSSLPFVVRQRAA
jgi:hypothetical protein